MVFGTKEVDEQLRRKNRICNLIKNKEIGCWLMFRLSKSTVVIQ